MVLYTYVLAYMSRSLVILFLVKNAGINEFLTLFNIYEWIQLTGFCVQETIISMIYMWQAVKLPKEVFFCK